MSRARKARRGADKRWAYKVPTVAPDFCAALDGMDEADARAVIIPGRRFAIGPENVLAAGGVMAAVTCDGPGQPFKVSDWRGDPMGTFMTWLPAADRMARVAAAHVLNLADVMRPYT